MPGPAPKPAGQRRRKDHTAPDRRSLPAEGRQGPTPSWPLAGDPSESEAAIWAELWATPQAVAWERLGWTRVVARYARLTIEAEQPGAQITLAGEVRQMEDRLGLTPMSLLRLRWDIAEPTEAAAVADISEAKERRRLKAVDDAVAGG